MSTALVSGRPTCAYEMTGKTRQAYTVFHQPQQNATISEIKNENNTIESVMTLIFLDQLLIIWDSHINTIPSKISRVIGVVIKIKYLFPFNALMLLYG